MSRLDALPPDQQAALSLLLRQHKSYREVAALLGVAESAVRDRAHGALLMLAPASARALTPERRGEVGDYLLRQQPVSERLRTRSFIGASEPARAWASELAAVLAPLADAGLPEIPAAEPAGAPAEAALPQRVGELRSAPAAGAAASAGSASPTPAGASSARSSRLGGAVLLVAIVAAVVVAVVLIGGGSGGHSHTGSTTASTGTSTTGANAKASGGEPKLDAEIPLTSPDPHSKSVGVVDIVSKGSQLAFLIEARNLPEAKNKGFYYAVWLYNSPKDFRGLTKTSEVGANHTLGGLAGLPSNAGHFHEILLTKETAATPTRPGRVILHGPFSLHTKISAKKQ